MKVTVEISAAEINRMYIKQRYAKKKTLSDETRTLIKAMYELGYSYNKVAKMFNVAVLTVYWIINPKKYSQYKWYMRNKKREQYNLDEDYREKQLCKSRNIYRKKQRFYAENKLTKVKGE